MSFRIKPTTNGRNFFIEEQVQTKTWFGKPKTVWKTVEFSNWAGSGVGYFDTVDKAKAYIVELKGNRARSAQKPIYVS